jgi:hypothetical protein
MAGAAPNQPCLTVLGGPMSGTQLVIEDAVDNILVGSDSSCKFCIPLPGVSPIHARIWLDAAGATVYDTHSTRGLYVNDDRVSGQAPLKNGDILWLGTPGEDDVVMIQCRLPRAALPVVAPPVPAPPVPEVLPEPEPEPLIVEPEPQPVEPEPLIVEPEPEPEPAPTVVFGEGMSDVLPAASEFYIEEAVDAPGALSPAPPAPVAEPAPTMVFADAPEEMLETVVTPPLAYAEPPLEPPLFSVPQQPVLTEFEDETLAVAPAPPAKPPPAPVPDAELEPVSASRREPQREKSMPAVEPTRVLPPPPTPVVANTETPRPRPAALAPSQAPRPAAVAPKPAPIASPPPTRPQPAEAASSGRGIAIAAGVLALVVIGGFLIWRSVGTPRTALVSPSLPRPATTQPLATLPAASPETPATPIATPLPQPVEEVVTIVKSPSPKAPSPSPTPSPAKASPSPSPKVAATPASSVTPGPSPEQVRAEALAAQVAGLVAQAEAAARPDEALRLYQEVLKLDPQNTKALAGKAVAEVAAVASRKRFAVGHTSVQGGKSKADVSGFDSADVQVLDAPGRIDFEVTPASVKAGDNYSVRVFFTNDGKKAIKLKSLSVVTLANGGRAGGPSSPRVREVAPQQRALLDEASGVWKEGTASFSVEVLVMSERGDSYRNQVAWK